MNLNRLKNYDKNHCWQYEMRINNRNEDLSNEGLTENYVSKLKVNDFIFKNIESKAEKQK